MFSWSNKQISNLFIHKKHGTVWATCY
jgi:hypothetical protein